MPDFSELRVFLEKYFPENLTSSRLTVFKKAWEKFIEWNVKVNLISRKDIENLAERHFLHSLSISKVIQFQPGTKVLDVGSGGGFPGLPLAILFPETTFHLVDSVAKKMIAVQDIVDFCGIENVLTSSERAEELSGQFDFVIARAISDWDDFMPLVGKRIHCRSKNKLENGVLYLKGGEVSSELKKMSYWGKKVGIWELKEWFEEEYFDTKLLCWLSKC